jgi:hypothetical protein
MVESIIIMFRYIKCFMINTISVRFVVNVSCVYDPVLNARLAVRNSGWDDEKRG